METVTFSKLIKEEISHLKFNNQEAKYLLWSFFMNNGKEDYINNQKCFLITSFFLSNIRLIKNLIKQLELPWTVNVYESNIKNAQNLTKWMIKIDEIDELNKYFHNFNFHFKKMSLKEQSSFFCGAFLASGSISFSKDKSNYHFEIRSPNINYLEELNKILEKIHIQANIIEYRNQYKIYVKKSEAISDILKFLNTNDALYAYEDIRIKRDFSNSLQRVNNLEVSNINKTIIAANQQILWIQTIINKHVYDKLDKRTKTFCDLRLANPEASLEEISKLFQEQHDLTIPRTSLNHLIRKIKKIYFEIKAKE